MIFLRMPSFFLLFPPHDDLEIMTIDVWKRWRLSGLVHGGESLGLVRVFHVDMMEIDTPT